ncbi:hypothetical protein CONPUDRAFT_83225 [Coniophora puteana RWD-64-598 SS2]|uniref:Uncharacterized protein n=1 Tax=Coniophora puteana (strain RWD-64-598) TaxID=741705 RepID=A0A5M3MLF4_CONPW|nr:uncharacterized protein CONPUDRAFT_83225 [Coniophora puteana RWD-64-598 SS2]EIW80059.1 hypothetical protein CONPUDRAFT_83225 [Coniophora puteana RWD-64-598 SS2]
MAKARYIVRNLTPEDRILSLFSGATTRHRAFASKMYILGRAYQNPRDILTLKK